MGEDFIVGEDGRLGFEDLHGWWWWWGMKCEWGAKMTSLIIFNQVPQKYT